MRIKARDANEEVIEIQEHDSASVELTEDELAGLKKLLQFADKLIGLVDKDEPVGDEDEEAIQDEEVIQDEDEDKKDLGDSFASVGAVHKTKKGLTDSDDLELGVSNAWAKRYGGK